MDKLRDILYDKNDILVALVIIVIAAFIIHGRMEAIMAYPETLIAEAGGGSLGDSTTDDLGGDKNPVQPDGDKNSGTATEPKDTEADKNKDTDTKDKAPSKDTAKDKTPSKDEHPVAGATTGEPTGVNYSVYVEYGSTGSQIAQLLLDCGLISQKTEFYDAVTAVNAENKLRAGSYIIPEGSTPAEIVRILTN